MLRIKGPEFDAYYEVLAETKWNRNMSAKILGVSAITMGKWVKRNWEHLPLAANKPRPETMLRYMLMERRGRR